MGGSGGSTDSPAVGGCPGRTFPVWAWYERDTSALATPERCVCPNDLNLSITSRQLNAMRIAPARPANNQNQIFNFTNNANRFSRNAKSPSTNAEASTKLLGGPGRNRTTDTRIFNSVLTLITIIDSVR